jgi:hypothetical protein
MPEPTEAGAFHEIIAEVDFIAVLISVGGPGADIFLFYAYILSF